MSNGNRVPVYPGGGRGNRESAMVYGRHGYIPPTYPELSVNVTAASAGAAVIAPGASTTAVSMNRRPVPAGRYGGHFGPGAAPNGYAAVVAPHMMDAYRQGIQFRRIDVTNAGLYGQQRARSRVAGVRTGGAVGGAQQQHHQRTASFAGSVASFADEWENASVWSLTSDLDGTTAGGGRGGGGGGSTVGGFDDDDDDLFDYSSAWKDQFLATIQRDATERRRGWCGLLLEIIVPLLCVACTIVLWAAFGDVHEEDSQPYSNGYTQYSARTNKFKEVLCYNETWEGQPNYIQGLSPCSLFRAQLQAQGQPETLLDCSGSGEGELLIPVKGLCHLVTAFYQLNQFMTQTMGPLAMVLPLDDIIGHHWLAKKLNAQQAGDASILISAGLASNNRYSATSVNGKFIFAPTSNVPEGLLDYINSKSNLFQYLYNGTVDTIEEAHEIAANERYGDIWAILHFKQFDDLGVDVEIEMNRTALPTLDKMFDVSFPGGFVSDRAEMYLLGGYASLARVVLDYYLETMLTKFGEPERADFTPYVAAAPARSFRVATVLSVAGVVLGFVVVLAFLYPVSQATRRLVLEKERRIREAMLIMGLKSYHLKCSWMLFGIAQNLLTSLLMTVLLRATYVRRSDPYAVFLIIFLFSLTTIPLSGLLSTFFDKSRMAALLTPLIYFAISVPYFAMQSASPAVITVLSLLSPTALAAALNIVFTREAGDGFSSAIFSTNLDNPNVSILIVFFIADFVLYLLLMLYFDAVLPKDVGTPKHPLFFIIDAYKMCAGWCGCCNNDDDDEEEDDRHNGDDTADGRDPNGVYEEEFIPETERVVDIVGLRKSFKRSGKRFVAVNNFCWTMPNEGISVLLGHNGAGKSTVMNMLTGMLVPDAGDCYVCGYSVHYALDAARQQIGFCPQHNILWPELTCREHLEYFAKIKGLAGPALEDAVMSTLEEVDLVEKADYPSSALSGGQKRKLSVAIAFVGGSRLVFLDEPTAGMDVAARRHTWELLLRMSHHRSVLLTTHFMDEADLLGDRIAIMSNGRLKCSGSSLFLKSRLGLGYNITMSLNPDADLSQLTAVVQSHVPRAESVADTGCEVSYRLPTSEVNAFPALLSALEEAGMHLGVRGYALSATTLEEVFLKVATEDHLANARAVPGAPAASTRKLASPGSEIATRSQGDSTSGEGYFIDGVSHGDQGESKEMDHELVWNCELVEAERSILNLQFRAMMWKRWCNMKRDRRMLCFQIVCPVVCVLLAMFLNLVNMSGNSYIQLTPDAMPMRSEMSVSNCDKYFTVDASTGPLVSEKLTVRDRHAISGYDLFYMLQDEYYDHSDARLDAVFCNDPTLMGKPMSLPNPILMFYNSSSVHQVGISLVSLYNMIIQSVRPTVSIQLATRHLPATSSDRVMADGIKTILIGIIIMIPFTFLPSNCVSWVVKEREVKSRHLQDVSGLRFSIYWLTNFLFDITAYLVTLALVIVIFLIFQRKEYVGADTAGGTVVLFVIFGFCSTSVAYLVHFAFKQHSSAQTIVMALGFITGFLLVIIVFILALMTNTRDASDKMRIAFRLIPTYAVGEGIINLATLESNRLEKPELTPWSMSVLGWPCVYMAIEAPLFFALTLLIDHPYWRLRRQMRHYDPHGAPDPVSDEDSDVEDERQEVIKRIEDEEENFTADAVSVVEMKKAYSNGKVAVRNITFGVVPGEVFGFLGTNGAGKTTTISILCQEFLPTCGQAFICGYDIVNDSREALQCIGYCPQFDATLDLLTVEEHLSVFAGIRGIVRDQHNPVIDELLSLCGLEEYRGTLAGELSGGNRRKLSVALALIGGPQVVFLDEPSAGMDPVARRGLWTSVQSIANRCSVVLTTHHLEEVEALADCVAIMTDGALRCIGNKTHLKNKYGSGFEMSLRIANASYYDAVVQFVETNFPRAKMNEFRGSRFIYALPKETPLSEVFQLMQTNKRELGITDYSVSQTSIEQVFMRISEEAEEAAHIKEELILRKRKKEKMSRKKTRAAAPRTSPSLFSRLSSRNLLRESRNSNANTAADDGASSRGSVTEDSVSRGLSEGNDVVQRFGQ